MKTVVIDGKQEARVIDVPVPRCFDNYSVVRIKSAPMCTEYRKYEKGEYCINIGHEAAGEVFEASASSKVKNGDRVIVMPQYPCGQCGLCLQGDFIHCENSTDPLKDSGIEYGTGTFAEYILKPDRQLLPIPDDISYNEAAMACCGLGPTFEAAHLMNAGSNDTILVTGLGPVGLGAVISCTFRGSSVIGVSRNEYRRELALQIGAKAVADPSSPDIFEKILDLTNGRGVDKVIECTGVATYQHLAIKAVRRKGHVAFIGESQALTLDVSNDLLRKGLTLHGIWHWNINNYQQMIDTIRASKQKIRKLITHTFSLDNVEEAFMVQLKANCGKVILTP